MNFLEKLNFLLKEKNVSRGELAKGSGVPYTTIVGLYEQGYKNIKLSTLRKIAKYFSVSLDYLADDTISERYLYMTGELKEIDLEWLVVTKRFRDLGISPRQVENLIELLKGMK